MVNDTQTFGIDPAGGHPEVALALSYAPVAGRRAIAAVFALDRTLERLALGTRDAMVAELRLAWWDEALGVPPTKDVPAQPILRTLRSAGLAGARAVPLVDAWRRVLADLQTIDLDAFAAERGTAFALAADVLGASDDVAAAGEGWALATLAKATANPALAARAVALAGPRLDAAARQRWGRAGRPLGALVHVARADLANRHAPGAPARVARLAWHRLTGR